MILKNKYFRINGDELLCSKILLILSSFDFLNKTSLEKIFKINKAHIRVIYFFDNSFIHESQKNYSTELLNSYNLYEMTIEELINYDRQLLK